MTMSLQSKITCLYRSLYPRKENSCLKIDMDIATLSLVTSNIASKSSWSWFIVDK